MASVLVALIPALAFSVEPALKLSMQCGDFLQSIRAKPSALNFVECVPQKKYGVDVVEAKYRVAGSGATDVEAFYFKRAGMPKLRYNCCGWEPYAKRAGRTVNAGQITFEKNSYAISMTSGESTVNQRRRWAEIDYFYVYVTLVIGDI